MPERPATKGGLRRGHPPGRSTQNRRARSSLRAFFAASSKNNPRYRANRILNLSLSQFRPAIPDRNQADLGGRENRTCSPLLLLGAGKKRERERERVNDDSSRDHECKFCCFRKHRYGSLSGVSADSLLCRRVLAAPIERAAHNQLNLSINIK